MMKEEAGALPAETVVKANPAHPARMARTSPNDAESTNPTIRPVTLGRGNQKSANDFLCTTDPPKTGQNW